MKITLTVARKRKANRLTMLALALGVAGAGPSAAQSENSVSLDGIALHLPSPAGYCSLDTNNSAEFRIFDKTAQALAAASSRLLEMAVVCDELAAFRTGGAQFHHFMEISVTLDNGAPLRVEDSRRKQYINQISATAPKLDMKSVGDLANSATQVAGVSTNLSQFGVLTQDDAAIYIGAVASYNNSAPLADVAAMTTAGGRAVSIAFYRNFVDSGTLTSLLEEAKHEARATIAANASKSNPPAGPRPQK